MSNPIFSSEAHFDRYGLVDGVIQTKKINTPWPTYDSSILDYMLDFDRVLDVNLIDFLSKRTYPIVIDFLATPSAIKDLFMRSNVTPGQGITVGYEDLRPAITRKLDLIAFGTVQITGDLNDRAMWHEVGTILQGDKADLILQRGRGGISNLPAERAYYNAARRHLWAALSEDEGLLVSQVHNDELLQRNGIDLTKWTNQLVDLGIDAQYVPGVSVERRTLKKDCFGILKLIKTSKSPVRLPLI